MVLKLRLMEGQCRPTAVYLTKAFMCIKVISLCEDRLKVSYGDRRVMKQLMRAVVFIGIATSGSVAFAQSDACANPSASRIGLLIQNRPITRDSTTSSQMVDFSKRLVAADTKFRDLLAQRLSADVCVVTNREVFNDPKNFPQLKGSTIIEIGSDASSNDPNILAIAVSVGSTQGVFMQDQLRMFSVPVLIESDSGYARGVDIVMKFWQFWADAATRDQKK